MSVVIHWFRQDLRLADNPALTAAAAAGKVLPIYILDDVNAGEFAMGAASRWWLHQSLLALNKALNGQLQVYQGDAKAILPTIVSETGAAGVFWNRCYEPWRIKRDKIIETELNKAKIQTNTFNGSLLWEPWEVHKADGTPYKVFTPFYQRGCLQVMPPREPSGKPKLTLASVKTNSCDIDALRLMPAIRWDKALAGHWDIGESGAVKRLNQFLEKGLSNYQEGRNFPAAQNISHLSPHLHFGELSPNQVWYAVKQRSADENSQCFLSELGWREFSYYLLYHFPTLPTENFQKKFDSFPWSENLKWLQQWQQGKTGCPIVDAGMRELWQTGFMHNRVRMLVASFLTKNLLQDWRVGERWFWDCLVDADLASNSAGWQWVAGCGADAAPYFRIFNPVTQGKKFDPEGKYTRRFVPELAKLPNKYLFNPWEAPDDVLKAAGVVLGENYPRLLIDLKTSREAALCAYEKVKRAGSAQ